jgi:peptidoglycan biosynthesis protein MviN/MurJ (putative lipid II flippase)
MYGAILTINGAVLTIIINLIFVRRFSYVAAAYGHLIAYFVTMVLSFWWGRKFYKIDYQLGKIAEYIGVAIFIFIIGEKILPKGVIITDILNGCFIIGYGFYIAHREDIFKIKRFNNENKYSKQIKT